MICSQSIFCSCENCRMISVSKVCHIRKKQMCIYICLALYLWIKLLGTLFSNIQLQIYTGTWSKKDFLIKVCWSILRQWVCPNNIQWQRCLGKWGTATKQHLRTLRNVCTEKMLLIRRYSPGIQEPMDNRSYFTQEIIFSLSPALSKQEGNREDGITCDPNNVWSWLREPGWAVIRADVRRSLWAPGTRFSGGRGAAHPHCRGSRQLPQPVLLQVLSSSVQMIFLCCLIARSF